MVIKSAGSASKPRKPTAEAATDLGSQLSRKIVGQAAAIQQIVPYIQMFEAGLAPEGRPVGVFLLLGPTGTGKTRTVEALAEVLHGSEKCVLKIDCGEYQMDHEVAKLIGAPPGYLGHRETVPMLTQQKLHAVTSERSKLSLVLFDEIEKAAPSLTRLLLGILDRATLRLGDNTTVNFENSLIFLTSNLGAREMLKELNPDFGFRAGAPSRDVTGKLEAIGLNAVRRRFSPEFINRIDAVLTYRPLDAASLEAILDQQIGELQRLIDIRLGERRFDVEVAAAARQFLLRMGTSREYGARELKRTIHRHLTQPLAALVAAGGVAPGDRVRVDLKEDGAGLAFQPAIGRLAAAPEQPVVLLVDDNRDLLRYLEKNMTQTGWQLLAAQSARQAYEQIGRRLPDAALLDYLLPDGSGIELAVELRRRGTRAPIIIMTGAQMGPEEEAVCEEYGFPVLRKPFLAADMVRLLRGYLGCNCVASA
ncbi:MAG: AAA family ATPase [Bryobacterales bacterium]|nr:AAA family ATPase [Bryobacteraceae bacterium]MDW8131047.1 AAA family ATPase [Bryobacterales bacterium]